MPALHAQQFSAPMSENKEGSFFFGLNSENFVASLRRLAGEVEKKNVFAQRVEVKSVAVQDDFLETHVTFVFVEKGNVLL